MFCSLRIQLADRWISIFQHIDHYVLPRSKSTQPTSALVTRRVKPIDLLNRIPQLKLQCLFPSIIIAIRIFLTLPVTVATGERSFSKLSFLKNKLRNSSTYDRVVSLSMLSIECDLVHGILHLLELKAQIEGNKIEYLNLKINVPRN